MSKILIIDDDEQMCETMKTWLDKKTEHEVVFALGGRKGLAAVSKEKPDLILLDLMMPDVSGIEVLKKLKKQRTTLRIPVVILTGRSEEEAMEESMRGYAEEFIAKPIGPEDLVSRVDRVLAVRRELSKLRSRKSKDESGK
jgi:two-component system phosphate regulon response regulator PhoB